MSVRAPVPVKDQPVGPEERGIVSHIGPVEIQWVRSLGYFGGIALAVAFEVIEPPLALFIAAVPFLKMLDRPRAPLPVRMLSQLVDGAAQPVGGEAQGTISLTSDDVPRPRRTSAASRPARPRRPRPGARSPKASAGTK
jgi:hypothetical protein